MQSDGPTLSNLPAYTPGASGEPEGTPPWPSPREGRQRFFGDERFPFGSVYPLILGISFFANVVLVVTLIGVLLATHTGFFAPGSSSPRVAAPGPTQSTPTATANLTPSTTGTGWLEVAPNSIHLTCDGGQRTQLVVLANTGTERVQWQVDISGSTDQAAVMVNPAQGDLRAGANVAIQIEINTHSDGSGSSGQQGVIRFDPDIPDAGAPASLSYTTDTCNN